MPLTALYRYYFGPTITATASLDADESDYVSQVRAEWYRRHKAHISGDLVLTVSFRNTVGDDFEFERLCFREDGFITGFVKPTSGNKVETLSFSGVDIRDLPFVSTPAGNADKPPSLVAISSDETLVFEEDITISYRWTD